MTHHLYQPASYTLRHCTKNPAFERGTPCQTLHSCLFFRTVYDFADDCARALSNDWNRQYRHPCLYATWQSTILSWPIKMLEFGFSSQHVRPEDTSYLELPFKGHILTSARKAMAYPLLYDEHLTWWPHLATAGAWSSEPLGVCKSAVTLLGQKNKPKFI